MMAKYFSKDGSTLIAEAQFGREDELWRLVELYQNPEELNPLAIITGINGMGKSELANTFGRIMTEMKLCGSILRLNGASDIRLYENLRQIAPLIGVPTKNSQGFPRDSLQVFNNCVSVMSGQSKPSKKIVLIIDNADDLEPDVSSLFTSQIVQSKCFTVVNSTNEFFSLRHPGEVINLDILQPEHSKQFILKELGNELECDLTALSTSVQNFPLALKLAVSCIKFLAKDEPYKIKDYLRDYQIQKEQDQPFLPNLNEVNHTYKQVIFTTLNLSLNKIKTRPKGQVALELLDMIAYFEPEQVFIDFLWRLHKHTSNDPFMDSQRDQFQSLIYVLYDYTLLKGTESACQFHRLIGQVTRAKINSGEEKREIELLKKMVKGVDAIYEQLQATDILHVMSLWKYASKYDDIIKEHDTFCDRIADKIQLLQLYKEKEFFVRGTLEGVKRALGEEHLQSLNMELQLAESLRLVGKNDESLKHFKECVTKQKPILGEDHPTYLITVHNMTLVLEAKGKTTEAIETFKNLLESQKKVFGPDHKETINSTRNLVRFLTKQGNHTEAIGILEKILEDRKSRLGEHHVATLTAMEMKGECLWESGATDLPNNLDNFKKAKELFERVVNLKEEHLGAFNSETCESKYNLALRLCGFNESGKSLELLNQVLKARVQVLGNKHPLTVETREAIAQVM